MAADAATLFDQARAEIHALDQLEHRRIQHDLESGGRLRLVVDAEGPLMRVRVRLVSAVGRNRWIWSRTVRA